MGWGFTVVRNYRIRIPAQNGIPKKCIKKGKWHINVNGEELNTHWIRIPSLFHENEWGRHTHKSNAWGFNQVKNLLNPNSCSKRIPIKRSPNIFARIWNTPACSQIQLIRRHHCRSSTILFTSRAPIFCSLKKRHFTFDWIFISGISTQNHKIKIKSPIRWITDFRS